MHNLYVSTPFFHQEEFDDKQAAPTTHRPATDKGIEIFLHPNGDWTHRRTDGCTDRRTGGPTDEQMNKHRQPDKQTDIEI